MTSPIYSLPLELINAIIDEIYNDSDTKSARRLTPKSCDLVSRIFVNGTREHLFREIKIRSNLQCQMLLARSFTTSLVITWTFRRGPGRLTSTLTDLPSIIDVLHNVNKIKLIGMRWISLSRNFIDSLASRSFISITLVCVHFTDSNAFYSFLSHSPNLREFSRLMTVIDNNNCPPFSASFDISHRPHITGLCLHKTNQIAEIILSPSLSPMILDRLHVLDVLLEQDHHFDLAGPFIDLATQSLEALHISQFNRPPPDRLEYLPIQRLRSITIEMMDDHPSRLPIQLGIFDWWIGHFETFSDLQCSSVHFLVRVPSYEVEASADYTAWKKLDISLSRSSVRSLVVDPFISKIIRNVPSETSPIKVVIEENLPILIGCKIAHVQVGTYNNDRNFIVDHQ
ncbi:hypothetical protein ARMSODRAFT_665003 [Armillaria solidipes]|uniref:F-box domain-containing protein n=1 Tax=Armillaria solidipes TaxID=1076256 RepID=A0A2H3AXG8_9AGAR|nr:hypothetical protein ARMSODRAFT_665003 [Armillaria solidipes]